MLDENKKDAFIRFLKDEHSWDEFKENFEKHRPDESLDEWLENPSIICAFPWDMPEQGRIFWPEMEVKWREKLIELKA